MTWTAHIINLIMFFDIQNWYFNVSPNSDKQSSLITIRHCRNNLNDVNYRRVDRSKSPISHPSYNSVVRFDVVEPVSSPADQCFFFPELAPCKRSHFEHTERRYSNQMGWPPNELAMPNGLAVPNLVSLEFALLLGYLSPCSVIRMQLRSHLNMRFLPVLP